MKSLFLSDRCLDPEVLTYDLPGSCRSFWACDGGESIPMCCPYGTSYHSGIGCLPDNKCKDPCPPRPTQHLNPRAIMSDKIDSKKNAPLREMALPGNSHLTKWSGIQAWIQREKKWWKMYKYMYITVYFWLLNNLKYNIRILCILFSFLAIPGLKPKLNDEKILYIIINSLFLITEIFEM